MLCSCPTGSLSGGSMCSQFSTQPSRKRRLDCDSSLPPATRKIRYSKPWTRWLKKSQRSSPPIRVGPGPAHKPPLLTERRQQLGQACCPPSSGQTVPRNLVRHPLACSALTTRGMLFVASTSVSNASDSFSGQQIKVQLKRTAVDMRSGLHQAKMDGVGCFDGHQEVDCDTHDVALAMTRCCHRMT